MLKINKNNFFGLGLVNFDIGNINFSSSGVWIFIIIILLISTYILYQSHTKWGFQLRKYARFSLTKKSSDRYKKLARILFIDDKDIPIAQTLEDDNWVVEKVRDAQIDDQKVKDANIIFVDWKGVARKISAESEGMALTENLKRKYGYEKYIILYSAREYQKPEGLVADDWINKGSTFSTYSDTIQKASFALFG